MVRLLLLIVGMAMAMAMAMVTGCGRLAFDPITGAGSSSGDGDGGGPSDGAALPATSCEQLASSCGATGMDGCCASDAVPGGTFYRGYDGTVFTDMTSPATVSAFRLDKYEITVGRFRKFVDAGMGTQAAPPDPGAGAHVLIAASGWDPAWNANLAADTNALTAALKCDATMSTWTSSAGANEQRPINCITWYEAMAFCAWDNGYLPTDAEWNFAATGGSDQRVYPAGPTLDPTQASYWVDSVQGCCGDGLSSCTLTDLIPVGTRPAGDGRWGHSEMAGNASEWTLDWNTAYPNPCVDCAQLIPATQRSTHGGAFFNEAFLVYSNSRGAYDPTTRQFGLGARCARAL